MITLGEHLREEAKKEGWKEGRQEGRKEGEVGVLLQLMRVVYPNFSNVDEQKLIDLTDETIKQITLAAAAHRPWSEVQALLINAERDSLVE